MTIHELPVRSRHAAIHRGETGHVLLFFWAALLALSAIGSSWALACVTPFAAFAFISARSLPLKTALGTVTLIWLANQAVGFLFLSYPLTISCVAWGLAMGVAALAATCGAAGIMRVRAALPVQLTLGFAVAFSLYEGLLLLMGLATSTMDGFTGAITGNFLLSNGLWAAGLLALYQIITALAAKSAAQRRAI